MSLVLRVLLLCVLPGLVWADTLRLSAETDEINPAAHLEFLEDKDGQLTIENLLNSDPEWQSNGHETFNKSYNDSSWWLRVTVQNTDAKPSKRLVEISYAVLDYIDFYVVDGDRVIDAQHMGDKLAFHHRVLDHRYFVVPVEWQPSQTLTLYIRVKSTSSVQVPILIWDEQSFYGFDTTRTILQGIFFGTMLVIAAYNLLIFFALGERTYLYYVGYVLCMPLFLSSLGGYSFRYFWPTLTDWNDQSIIVFLSGVVIFGTLFTSQFLNTRKHAPLSETLLKASKYGGFLLVVSAFILPYSFNITAVIILACLACVLALITGIYCWNKGITTAKYYTIAWSSMLGGGLVLAMSKAGILPANLFTEYATHIGSSLEVVLLSFALAERINEERRLRFEAQAQTLQTTRRTNEELEHRVQERTQELEELTKQLLDLSNTDQLTGLCNRRHLDQSMLDEWQRAKRYQRSLAIILMDIDHFKQVNDTHGHLVGDDCLKAVALRIQEGVRWPSDLIARYGGEEFFIMLPETEMEGAVTVAERIRKLIDQEPLRTRSGALSLTISAGISAIIPDESHSIESLIISADRALYEAKHHGRNKVMTSLAA